MLPGDEIIAKSQTINSPEKASPMMDITLVVLVFTFNNPRRSIATNDKKKNSETNPASSVRLSAIPKS